MSNVRRAVAVGVLSLGTASVAAALPIQDTWIDMDYTATGQIIVDVHGSLANGLQGGSVENGRFTGAAGSWDPLSLLGGNGTVDNMALFGSDTADTSDNFVRFWLTYGTPAGNQVWVMSSSTSNTPGGNDIPVAHAPEPASLMLFGTGLVGLVAAARRRRKGQQ